MGTYSDLWSLGILSVELVAGWPPIHIPQADIDAQCLNTNGEIDVQKLNELQLKRIKEFTDLEGGLKEWYRCVLLFMCAKKNEKHENLNSSCEISCLCRLSLEHMGLGMKVEKNLKVHRVNAIFSLRLARKANIA